MAYTPYQCNQCGAPSAYRMDHATVFECRVALKQQVAGLQNRVDEGNRKIAELVGNITLLKKSLEAVTPFAELVGNEQVKFIIQSALTVNPIQSDQAGSSRLPDAGQR